MPVNITWLQNFQIQDNDFRNFVEQTARSTAAFYNQSGEVLTGIEIRSDVHSTTTATGSRGGGAGRGRGRGRGGGPGGAPAQPLRIQDPLGPHITCNFTYRRQQGAQSILHTHDGVHIYIRQKLDLMGKLTVIPALRWHDNAALRTAEWGQHPVINSAAEYFNTWEASVITYGSGTDAGPKGTMKDNMPRYNDSLDQAWKRTALEIKYGDESYKWVPTDRKWAHKFNALIDVTDRNEIAWLDYLARRKHRNYPNSRAYRKPSGNFIFDMEANKWFSRTSNAWATQPEATQCNQSYPKPQYVQRPNVVDHNAGQTIIHRFERDIGQWKRYQLPTPQPQPQANQPRPPTPPIPAGAQGVLVTDATIIAELDNRAAAIRRQQQASAPSPWGSGRGRGGTTTRGGPGGRGGGP